MLIGTNTLKNLRTLGFFATIALASLTPSLSRASEITNAYAGGYSPAIYCHSTFHDQSDVLQLTMTQWGAGQIGGVINTDNETDPTLTLQHVINNATGIAWSSYHVSVFMPNVFTIGGAVVNSPGGWTSVITAPVAVLGGFQGQVDYTGGPTILPGGTIDFQFAITFANGLNYSFTEDASPGLVPEPSTFALALLGLAAFGVKKSRKSA